MARTTAAEVLEILPDGTGMTSTTISPFIDTASLIVDDLDDNTTIVDGILVEIEKYLAAHLISITKERQGVEEKLGEAEIKYTGRYGLNLEMTSYGQMATVLDTSGRLKARGQEAVYIKAIKSFDD